MGKQTVTMKLEFCPSPQPNKTGVLLLPGGGYGNITNEKGLAPAQWLNERGYDAWVLSYTVSCTEPPVPIYPKPRDEALAAIVDIRSQKRITTLGIWGWSAGGHLAAITATRTEAELDFAILTYPVITLEHGNLVHDMSAQNGVSKSTPPTFILHTANDALVSVQNALLFAAAMAEHQRPFQLVVLPDGPHGIGLALEDEKHSWTDQLERWLKEFVTPV
ncbi:Alpha/Beta hydrolase protein [Pseudomassariella vexata]|uniref:Alpha/Beta hydrolase protein n=1 Tax=Pseudomassariella vexata TaxID=1141098 RepID=A0A1Y2DZT6_9PEZI|nr:Alpha/Beta hydrolase protein [Pseudomassariella vexata]ORY64802.1 Alpha/Beta hydrolase protein [Pseudomassariella vexata]